MLVFEACDHGDVHELSNQEHLAPHFYYIDILLKTEHLLFTFTIPWVVNRNLLKLTFVN